MRRIAMLGLVGLVWCTSVEAVEQVKLVQKQKEITLEGRVETSAQDGGLLVLARDGVLWTVQPNELVSRSSDKTPFAPLSADEISTKLLAQLPRGFNVHRTTHYVILYNTSRDYGGWCGALFERLYMAFRNYWSRKGLELSEPPFPLVAIVFSSEESFREYGRAEVGEGIRSIIGYYHLQTNRMVMYDLTGSDGGQGTRGGAGARIARILAQPDAEINVATIVHEATHQIAFNCGLHVRCSDCPRWFSEGIAIYFETPDLRSTKGWTTIGALNRNRQSQFLESLKHRPPRALSTMLSDDKLFGDSKEALDAYAQAWALTYFLIRQHPKEYLTYQKFLGLKQPMMWDSPEQRLRDFKMAFGDDLNRLDAEFVRYMLRAK